MSGARHILFINEFFHPDICASAAVAWDHLVRIARLRPNFKITVIAVNDDPLANDDSYPAILEGGAFLTTNNVDDLAFNDTDVEDGKPTGNVTLVTGPSYHSGVFTLNADATFTYTHDDS